MSHVSSQGQGQSWISIPFEKYSHNTSRIGSRKYAWSHIGPRSDLVFVIRNVRAVDDQGNYTTRVVLRVSAGAELLETQDLGDLVACHQQFDASLGGENPVQVVVRPPVWIAMAYPKGSAAVQRTQYKFFNETDFCKALAAFKDLGFPTRESPLLGPSRSSTPSAPPPPSSSPAISVFSASSASTSSTTASSIYRPASALRRSPLANEILCGQASNTLPINLPLLPEATHSQQRSSLMPFALPHDPTGLSLGKSMAQREISGISGQSLLQALSQQSSERLTRRHTESGPNLPSELILPNFQTSETGFRPNYFSSRSNEHTDMDNYENREDPCNLGTTSLFFATQRKEFNKEPYSSDPLARLRQNHAVSSPNSPIERPSSAPTDPVDIQDLAIPPKRAPPFPPPKKIRAASVADLPPLPKPTPLPKGETAIRPPILPNMQVPTPKVQPTKKRVAQRKGPVHPVQSQSAVPTPAIMPDDGSVALDPPPALPNVEVSPLAAKSAVAVRPSSAGSVLQTKATSTVRKRPAPSRPTSAAKRLKAVDQSTQTEPYSDHPAVLPVSSKVTVPEPARNAEPSASPPADYLGTLDNFVTKHKDRPPPREIYKTPEYLQASPEEREILVSNFICENLQNPEFIQLCKDMEHSWRRIGLGM